MSCQVTMVRTRPSSARRCYAVFSPSLSSEQAAVGQRAIRCKQAEEKLPHLITDGWLNALCRETDGERSSCQAPMRRMRRMPGATIKRVASKIDPQSNPIKWPHIWPRMYVGSKKRTRGMTAHLGTCQGRGDRTYPPLYMFECPIQVRKTPLGVERFRPSFDTQPLSNLHT